ncbi:MAG: patatin-like phospholipase family protein [Myxococcota bacterium]
MARDLAITFAGGGSRAFYQLGWLQKHRDALLERTASISGCSAGSAMATLLLTDRIDETKAFFAERRRGIRGHIVPKDLLRGRRPFPHDAVYRDTLRFALRDGGFERVKAAPFPVHFLCSAFPKLMPTGVGIALGLGLYQLEKRMRPDMKHPTYPRRVGFIAHHADARKAESPEELIELILSSSSTPPFTKRGRHRAQRLVDGSLIDNAPAFLAEEQPGVERTLVLMTRPHTGCPAQVGSRLYIAPEAPLPITRWDYRENAPVDETFAVGRADGEAHADLLSAFLR